MSKDGKNPGGRPTKYKPEFVDQVRPLCENGATDEEIAAELEVDVATIYRWKNLYPMFCEAIKAGKAPADDRVERSLYREAIAGNVTAQIFWLKNRRRQEWQDGQVVRHELPTAEELEAARGIRDDV